MQDIVVNLSCEMGDSFRCNKAANSVSLDVEQKSEHSLVIKGASNINSGLGLIYGSSGSGKTSLARSLYGNDFDKSLLDMGRPVIDQFDETMSYDDCATALSGIGLTSIPCWIRPAYTLSNGQRARAEAALALSKKTLSGGQSACVIDEWTSVVDRTVAKIMSHRLQKVVRQSKIPTVVLSCHSDVIEWLTPDWVIDCNLQTFTDYRGDVKAPKRQDSLRLTVRQCDKRQWKYFSKYHYLSQNIAPDTRYSFGLFVGDDQIGFVAFTRYAFKNDKMLHSNRVVIHPDYVGLGLGIRLVDAAAEYLSGLGYEIRAKFTSAAMLKHRMNNKNWALISRSKVLTSSSGAVGLSTKSEWGADHQKVISRRNAAKSFHVIYYIFRYVSQSSS